MTNSHSIAPARMRPASQLILVSRWLQLPLYVGFIVAQVVYVWQLMQDLTHLFQTVWTGPLTETATMLIVLGMIDVVMIANVLIRNTDFSK